MRYNLKYLLLLILFKPYCLFSQTEKETLTSTIYSYIKAINENDFDKQVDFFPEFVFDSISKTELLKGLKLSQNFTKTNIIIDSIFKIDTIVEVDNKKYTRINLPQKMSMNFSEFKDEGGMDFAFKLAYLSLVKEFGKDNVKINKEEFIIEVNNEFPIYGVKENSSWKFIPSGKMTNKNYFPLEVLEKPEIKSSL